MVDLEGKEIEASMDATELRVILVLLEKRGILVFMERMVFLAEGVILVPLVKEEILERVVYLVYVVKMVDLAKMGTRVPPVDLVLMDFQVLQVLRVIPVQKAVMVIMVSKAQWVMQDLRDSLESQENLALVEKMGHLVQQVTWDFVVDLVIMAVGDVGVLQVIQALMVFRAPKVKRDHQVKKD